MELKTANIDLAITQEGDPIRVQIGASGVNPVGAIKPAIVDNIGIVPSLRFDAGIDSVAGAAFAIPDKADPSKTVCCRIGWCSTTNTGDVKWDLSYKWVGSDDAVTGAADGVVNSLDTVSTTVEGYVFSDFDFETPSNGHRILLLQIERNGTDGTDDNAGAAHFIGILCDFIAGP